MSTHTDIIGHRFGRLVVLSEAEPKKTSIGQKTVAAYLCECECGNVKTVRRNDLVTGNTKSCGCLEEENRQRINKNFVKNKIWEHENTLKFHEFDTQEKGTRLTSISPERVPKNNTSGIVGVSWDKSRKKWVAQLSIKGKRVYRQRFENKQDAIKGRKAAEDEYFKPILEKFKSTKGE